uniref:SAP domain-containing protein n=1 Tax=Litorimonas sp. TaxID=1892381 RepID=UPI003A88CA65
MYILKVPDHLCNSNMSIYITLQRNDDLSFFFPDSQSVSDNLCSLNMSHNNTPLQPNNRTSHLIHNQPQNGRPLLPPPAPPPMPEPVPAKLPTEDGLKSWPVKKLKNCLRDAGLHPSGLKNDLVKRLLEYYKKNPSKVPPKPPTEPVPVPEPVPLLATLPQPCPLLPPPTPPPMPEPVPAKLPTEDGLKSWPIKKLKNCLRDAGLYLSGPKNDLVKR